MASSPRVVFLHNRYRIPGGEERTVEDLSLLLAGAGIPVSRLVRSSADLEGPLGRGRAAIAMLGGGERAGAVERLVRSARANIVHVHNLTPLFGPRALAASRRAGARIVAHVHNYRLVCATATAFRDGRACSLCHGRNTAPGLRLRCRGGLGEAATYAAAIAAYQARVHDLVDTFVVPSVVARDRLLELGFPPARFRVMPGPLREADFEVGADPAAGRFGLFVGRLSAQKGVEVAIRAAARAEIPLRVAGQGLPADEERLRALAAELGAPVTFLGPLDAAELAGERGRAAFAVVPSLSAEPLPYSATESLAAGLPVLASDLGGLCDYVPDDLRVGPGDVDGLAARMQWLWSDPGLRAKLGQSCAASVRKVLSPQAALARLREIYAEVLEGA